MGSLRPWHIVLFAAALIAFGAGLYFGVLRNPNKVERASSIFLVDAVTGELFEYHFGGLNRKGVIVPAIHPDTGERTLFRASQGEDGSWELDPRDLYGLEQQPQIAEAFDLDGRTVEPLNPDAPKKMTRADITKHLGG